eukprot:GCRY01001580.1.p1 GENE.GCRY01001580.1~~GCRY01001580.1.p1  ORF type:complete len:176 (-),score=9.87 GCRY01001580.1:208-735(-)
MHSVAVRANAVFCHFVVVLGTMCVGCAISALFFASNPVVNLQLNSIETFRHRPSLQSDEAIITFDLDADLTSVFNWNVKQLFVFVKAEYATDSNKRNEVIIWDRIITNKESANLHLVNERVEYLLADHGSNLRGKEINLVVTYNVMPICGLLTLEGDTSTHFSFPAAYTSEYGGY